jgi:TonB-dependent starch-binding outer membrane protein SusC
MKQTQQNPFWQPSIKAKSLWLFALILMLVQPNVFAKTKTLDKNISGIVTDAAKAPLVGVSIAVKGTRLGTTTDNKGFYKLSIPDNQANPILVFSYVGYASQEIAIGNRSQINLELEEDVKSLADVVVIGYGTQKVKDLTGSVGIVKVDEAKKTATYDVAKMLQGQVAGVTVQSSGEPGGFTQIKIRGISTFGNNSPLFVIDGVPVDSPYDFNPGDIESVQVLKDASAGAIYGSRAATGVVIITTKKGKEGPLKVSYNGYAGVNNIARRWDLMGREGYQKVVTAAETNAGLGIAPANNPTSPRFISNVNTDWQKEVLQTGKITDHNLNFSGGNKSLQASVSVGYFGQTPTVTGPQRYDRYTLNTNLTGQKGKFDFGVKLALTSASKVGTEETREHAVFGGPVTSMLAAIPTMSVLDPARLGGFGGSDNNTQRAITLNVVGMNSLLKGTDKRNRMLANVWGQYEILKNLKYKLNLSNDRLDGNYEYFEPEYDLGFYYLTPNATYLQNRSTAVTSLVENTLTYNFKIGKNSVDLLGGYTFQNTDFSSSNGKVYGLTLPYIKTLSAPIKETGSRAVNGVSATNTLESYLARVNYNFDDKFLLTGNFRRDGSSRFSPANRYGDFISVAGAINLHNLIPMPTSISSIKLRGGIGTLGNQNIGNYIYDTYINAFGGYVFGGALSSGAIQTQVVDPSIKWESKRTSNVAVDVNMFNDKLGFTVEYFDNTAYDMLAEVGIPYSVGATNGSITTNAASVRNNGVEIQASYRNRDNAFKYEISGNIHTLKNEVLELGGQNTPIYGAASITEVGSEVGQLYGYISDGIFANADEVKAHAQQLNAAAGDIRFKDINGDKIINADDRTYLGSAIPKLYYGANFFASYSNFDFSMFWQGHGGNKVYNGVYRDLMGLQYSNGSVDALNFWTPSNTKTNVPRPIIGDPNANNRDSDRFIESGSYIRLQNAQIGFNLPASIVGKVKGLASVRAYVSGQNIVLLSKYKGFDPDFMSNGLFARGYDYGSYPNPRTIMVGLQIGL